MRISLVLGCVVATGALMACSIEGADNSDDDDTSGASNNNTTGGGSDGGQGGTAQGTGGTTATGGSSAGGAGTGAGPTGCTAAGLELINEVNAYRMKNGKAAIPASSSLCIVAETHVNDSATNNPAAGDCNLHSWSDQGSWFACCYTPDHAQAQCMWDKPRELTMYPGDGYEISYSGPNDPVGAVNAWSGSMGHNTVMLNLGQWENFPFSAMGAAIGQGYAHVWFGQEIDPAD